MPMKAVACMQLSVYLMTTVPALSKNKFSSSICQKDSARPNMIVMPVTFVNLRSIASENSVTVSFTNLTEQNLDYYEVESSADGSTLR